MINSQLLNPTSIVVIGGSNDISKPGGKVLKNIIDGTFGGQLFVVNPKETEVQGIKSFANPADLPQVDLAVLAIAAKYCLPTIEILAKERGARAFIILSAGFSEESHEGAEMEKKIVALIDSVGGVLIGPNCIGVMTPNHQSVFTLPIPKLEPQGADFISGSGATACFIMEAGIPKGLTFSSVFSVGNSAQTGVEEVLEYLDENFDSENSSRIKLLYIENISKPQKLLKHASSLIEKGCKIAAVKAGSSEAGSRAASSHTGAMATPDFAVDTLFRKAGIVRCYGREDLIAVASVFMHKPLNGNNIAIITHAGGPAVMLTDALSQGGLQVPHIEHPAAKDLLTHLFPGSSVANPIDFLATGNAEQLGTIMDYADQKFDEIDAMIVIFGTPGLFKIFDVYNVLHEMMQQCHKPVYPVLPSTLTASEEVADFISKGHVFFPDEVVLGNALARVYATPKPATLIKPDFSIDKKTIREIIENSDNGYLEPVKVQALLDAVGIPRAGEAVVQTKKIAVETAEKFGYPVVMKVVGPVHKSDKGGVILDVKDSAMVEKHFDFIMKIEGATSVMIQPMLKGAELFAGVKYEPGFGHMLLCGLGGIFIEVLKDVSATLVPASKSEASAMIKNLKGYKLFKGVRGKPGINEDIFAEIIVRLSALIEAAPEITELDLNPLLGLPDKVVAVDARMCVEKA
ncbi:MAG: acetate--CoA ligase family protein [Bacteroidales bacterium]|nr:acetate--CoA ligase family protein [Bacteroidales bacterium]